MYEIHALRLVAARVHLDMADHRVRDQGAVSGVQGIFHRGKRAAEIRKGPAAAFAGATVVTGRTAVVALRHDRGPADGERASKFLLCHFPQPYLSTTHFHRRKKLSVGQHLVALCGTTDADITLYDVV